MLNECSPGASQRMWGFALREAGFFFFFARSNKVVLLCKYIQRRQRSWLLAYKKNPLLTDNIKKTLYAEHKRSCISPHIKWGGSACHGCIIILHRRTRTQHRLLRHINLCRGSGNVSLHSANQWLSNWPPHTCQCRTFVSFWKPQHGAFYPPEKCLL